MIHWHNDKIYIIANLDQCDLHNSNDDISIILLRVIDYSGTVSYLHLISIQHTIQNLIFLLIDLMDLYEFDVHI